MNGFLAFTKKEFLEHIRTYRVLIMLSVFFLFGMMSPLSAKLLPEIISGMELQGITIILPEATAFDAYGQFFKNITQMGNVVFLLVFGGILSGELTKGTLINILAKGISRRTIILAKYFAALTLWTGCIVMASLVNQGYTAYLFDVTGISNLIFSHFCLWLFGALILALILLSSSLTGGNFGGLILTVVILGVLLILNVFPAVKEFNPVFLNSNNLQLLTGEIQANEFIKAIAVTIGLTLASIIASIGVFKNRKI